MNNKFLVVVDMQNDFIDGSLGTKEAQAIVPRVAKRIRKAIDDGWFIIYTQDTHYDNYLETNEGKHLPVKHCIEGTEGWQINEEILAALITETEAKMKRVEKNTFGSFLIPFLIQMNAGEASYLKGECEVEFVGLCTDICVVSNALLVKSMAPEANLYVNASCCAGTTPERHKAALDVMYSCHINIRDE